MRTVARNPGGALSRRAGRVAALLLLGAVLGARGGLGPMQTLVVVNGNDRESRALGEWYAEVHGLPANHVCTVKTKAGRQNISVGDFEGNIRAGVEEHLRKEGLRGQIQAVVYCWQGPTRVGDFNSLTGVHFYGFKEKGGGGCRIEEGSRNRYFGSGKAFSATGGWSETGAPIGFVLTARDLATAKAVAQRGAESAGVALAGGRDEDAVMLVAGSGDPARSVRSRLAGGAAARLAAAGMEKRTMVAGSPPADPPKMAVCELGQGCLPGAWRSNGVAFAAGAYADNLTSCGGQLPDPCYGQHGVWEWLEAGATATSGTVSEPCNFPQKFAHPMMAYWYGRGFSAGEALLMSVENPYQLLFAGDPLAAPFAAGPTVRLLQPNGGEAVGGTVELVAEIEAHEAGTPGVYADLYIDGRFYTPMARPLSAAGNEIRVRIGGEEFRHTIGRDEDLTGVAEGLAWDIRSGTDGRIQAVAVGDAVFVTCAAEEDGRGPELSARVEAGLGKEVRAGVRTGGEGGRMAVVEEGKAAGAVFLHLGAVRKYRLPYAVDLSFLPEGAHRLTVVVRDGTAVQAQGQADVTVRIVRPGS